jgi:hypothetical protein
MCVVRTLAAALVLASSLAITACTPNTTRGAVLGAAAGAGLGALGHGGIVGNAAKGAAIGGLGGFIYDQF